MKPVEWLLAVLVAAGMGYGVATVVGVDVRAVLEAPHTTMHEVAEREAHRWTW